MTSKNFAQDDGHPPDRFVTQKNLFKSLCNIIENVTH